MSASMSWRIAGFAPLLLAGLMACQTVATTAPGTVGVDRKQRMLVSEEQIAQAAAQSYAQELDKARANNALNTDTRLLARVRAITDRLIPQTGVFRPDAAQWDWAVNVETSDKLNAYCMPGGKIMVYSGLVHKLSLTDAELASVIGHEMAHALREHSRERVSRAYAQQLAITGVAAVAGLGQGTVDLVSAIGEVTFQLPHSREQEVEADIIGLELMARGGYDPRAAPSVWRKMAAAQSGSAPPEFLSTHPSGATRITDLEANIPKVLPLYEAARK
ncbi:MAG TPA: M48 family metallopeptidase [Steroidobacteraceae bacterium]|jgi:predicted Zn-dependent protease|nr:M48 family metallopeptidase [Steroidobacteraceae bacterium]